MSLRERIGTECTIRYVNAFNRRPRPTRPLQRESVATELRDRGALRALLAMQMVSSLGRCVFFACTAIYFTQLVHLEVRQIGLALTCAGAAGVVSSYLAGVLSDLISARRLPAVALVLEGTSLLCLTWATSITAFTVLAVVQVAMNRGGATARQTLVARLFRGPGRTQARSQVRVATNLGIALGGAAAAGVLAASNQTVFRVGFSLAAAMYFLAAWTSRRIPADQVARHSQTELRPGRGPSVWRDQRYLLLAGLQGVVVTSYSLLETAVPIWVVTQTEAPPVTVSGILMINTAVVVVLQVRLSRGLEEPAAAARAFWVAGILVGLGCGAYFVAAGLPAVGAVVALLLAVFIQSLGEVLFAGAGFSMSFELADSARVGAYQGVYGVGSAAGYMLGPAAVTAAITAGAVGWGALATLYFGTGLGGWALVRRARSVAGAGDDTLMA